MTVMTKPTIGARLKKLKKVTEWSYPRMEKEFGGLIPWQTLRNYIEGIYEPNPLYSRTIEPKIEFFESQYGIVYDD